MNTFFKVRLVTFINTCCITYFLTGDLVFTTQLSSALIISNTIIMYILLNKKQ